MYELYPQYSTVHENYFFAQDERSRCAPPTLSEDEITDLRSADWFKDMRRLNKTDPHPLDEDIVSGTATSASLMTDEYPPRDDDPHQDLKSEDDQDDFSGEDDDFRTRNSDTQEMEAEDLFEKYWD